MDFIGTTGNDSLPASAGLNGGDDTFLTNGGRDTIAGGEGNDSVTVNGSILAGSNLSGGNGIDTLVVTNFAVQLLSFSFVTPAGIPSSSAQLVGPGSVFSSFERVIFDSDADTAVSLVLGFGGIFPNYLTTGGVGELVGGDGLDALALAVVYSSAPGAPASYNITAPTFTYTNWTTPDRAYLPGDRIALSVSGNAGGVINGVEHQGVLGMTGANGNDTINGSEGMDLLNGGAGANQLFGNGGDDTLVLINTQVVTNQGGNIIFQPPSFLNGAGSLYDGGDGFDFMMFGGKVFFAGTLANIEGIYLSPAVLPPLPATVPSVITTAVLQQAAFVAMDGAVFAQLPSDLLVAGEGTIEIDLADGESIDLSGVQFDEGAAVNFEIYAATGIGVQVTGSSGDDYIELGDGDQTATGGAGADTFGIGGGFGVVTDFNPLEDKIDLSETNLYSIDQLELLLEAVGGSLTQQGADVVLDVTYQGDTVHFTLQNVQLSDLNNDNLLFASPPPFGIFLPGSPFDDFLIGGAFNDTIQGFEGSDTIIGFGGIDSIDGGAGNDFIIIDTPFPVGPPSIYNGGADFDTLVVRPNANAVATPQGTTSTSYSFNGPTAITNIEAVRFDSAEGQNVSLNFVNRIGTVPVLFPTPGTLIGGAGNDNFNQIAVLGMGAASEYVIPTFTTVNWQPAVRAYLPGDLVLLIGVDSATPTGVVVYNYVLRANATNAANGLNQALFGSNGNDTLLGSDGADLLNGQGGVNVLRGNGGNDALFINNASNSTFSAALTTFTGAGSIFDGGDGTDFLGVGGAVNFQGTLISIEGIYLQPGFALNNASFGTQAAAELTISAAKLAALTNSLELDGVGEIIVDMAPGNAFNGSLYQFTEGADVTFTVNGSSSGDRIIGTIKGDALIGNDGNDTITGGEGDDSIDGGVGNDTMAGGTGDDTYLVDGGGDVVLEAADAGTDTILTSGGLSIARFGNVENLTGNGDLTGNARDNVITGGEGSDAIDGQAGADTMNGGDGDDIYGVDNAGDVINDTSGTDTVRSRISYTLATGLENLELLARGVGTGNEAANIIIGSTGADTLMGLEDDDSLVGGASADTLDGGAGNDTMEGGVGGDSYVVDSSGDVVDETGGDGIDTVTASVLAYTLTEGVERLVSSGEGSFAFTGNDLANRITTGAGDDTLDGGAGDDTLSGGAGNDTYRVDSSGDRLFETSGIDTVITTAASYTLVGGLENLIYEGVGGFTGIGSFEGNTITGAAGNDSLDGGNGSDALNGLGGNDTLIGGNQNDTLSGGDDGDVLIGGGGRDVLEGGAGSDTFRFLALADSRGGLVDVVSDFVHGEDKLDYSAIDTSPVAGDQGFAFIGGAAFVANGTAQIRTFTLNGNTFVSADVDGNRTVDMLVQLSGIVTLDAGDFLL